MDKSLHDLVEKYSNIVLKNATQAARKIGRSASRRGQLLACLLSCILSYRQGPWGPYPTRHGTGLGAEVAEQARLKLTGSCLLRFKKLGPGEPEVSVS